MIDIMFQMNKVLTELRTLEDFIKYYGEDNKDKMLELVDNAATEITKLKVYTWEEDDSI